MKYQKLGASGVDVPVIALGCMRLAGRSKADAEKTVRTALDCGINFFEHADIYGGGKSEAVFADSIGMNDDVREKLIIQTKCGIHDGMYDFSKEHILKSVDGSLSRLKTDYVDFLVLHRPDALVEPEEVAETFRILKESGKVRNFGVSNHNSFQIELLSSYLDTPICVDQLQFSVAHTVLLDAGLNVNMTNAPSVQHDGMTLDYCRLKNITIQAWSPFQFGFFNGCFIDHPDYPELNKVMERIAKEHKVTKEAVAIAFILRHPAKIQTLIGCMSPEHITSAAKAADITLSRTEWYDLYKSAGNRLP